MIKIVFVQIFTERKVTKLHKQFLKKSNLKEDWVWDRAYEGVQIRMQWNEIT